MRRNEKEEKGEEKQDSAQREHPWTTRETPWFESGMFHENLEDDRKGKSFGETSWDCASNQVEDGIPEELDKWRNMEKNV